MRDIDKHCMGNKYNQTERQASAEWVSEGAWYKRKKRKSEEKKRTPQFNSTAASTIAPSKQRDAATEA